MIVEREMRRWGLPCSSSRKTEHENETEKERATRGMISVFVYRYILDWERHERVEIVEKRVGKGKKVTIGVVGAGNWWVPRINVTTLEWKYPNLTAPIPSLSSTARLADPQTRPFSRLSSPSPKIPPYSPTSSRMPFSLPTIRPRVPRLTHCQNRVLKELDQMRSIVSDGTQVYLIKSISNYAWRWYLGESIEMRNKLDRWKSQLCYFQFVLIIIIRVIASSALTYGG